MQMILPILCGILILAGFVALFMSRETWRVYQIVLVLFLLLANAVFFYLGARTLYLHRAWRSEVAKYEQAYAAQEDQQRQLTGELDGRGEVIVDRHEKTKQNAPWTIEDWKAELAEAMYGRGRVLYNVRATKVDPATGAISAVVEQPDPVTLPKGSSVYVFQSQAPRERPLDYKGRPVTIATPPIVRYLGDYLVSNLNDRAIELLPVDAERKINVTGPLVIFELSPVDTHEAFAHLLPKEIRSLFPPAVPPEVVEQYVHDGKPATPQDPPDQVWRRVRFKKEYAAKDDQARPAPANPPPAGAGGAVDQPADETAAAVVPTKLTFQPGDEAILDPQTAQQLVESGTAEYVKNDPDAGIYSHVYVRPLRDYPLAFREMRTQLLATNLKLGELARQIQAVQKSIELGKQTEQRRKEEAGRLAQDLEKFTFESATAKKFHDDLGEAVKTAYGQIGALKQSIGDRAQQLARLQLQAAEAIDRRTTAANTP
jgi:hypothetical protein